MKTRNFLLMSLAVLFAATATAQRTPDVEENCKGNNSVFYEYAKNGNYADALLPWEELYRDCPEYSKNIYKYGALIIKWQIEKEQDVAKKEILVDKLMQMYDNRIKYFGDDANIPAPRILGLKAIDYYVLPTSKDPLKKEAYKWLSESIDGLGDKTDAAFLQYYILLSTNIYRNDPTHLDKLIQDYVKTNDILSKNASDPNNSEASYYAQVQEYNNKIVADSRAIDTKTLDKLYAGKIEPQKDNLSFLNSVIGLYKSVGATESPIYFSAAVCAHQLQPTEESAVGCASMSIKQDNYTKAVNYFEEATTLAATSEKKALYELSAASLYADKLNNFSKAREHARRALDYNPNLGDAYLLIGSLYARSTSVYSDPVLSKTVYWVAVDKFMKAKQVDASVTSKANSLINTYSQYFPADNDMFMHPELEKGKPFTVGGWIGETTICR